MLYAIDLVLAFKGYLFFVIDGKVIICSCCIKVLTTELKGHKGFNLIYRMNYYPFGWSYFKILEKNTETGLILFVFNKKLYVQNISEKN